MEDTERILFVKKNESYAVSEKYWYGDWIKMRSLFPIGNKSKKIKFPVKTC